MLNLLLTLIEKYEQENYPIEESEPHSILWELMEANNLQEKDLSDILGSKTIVSDILIGKQIITEKQAVKLGQFFHVDSSTLVTNSTHLVDFCLTIEMANSPQICLNRG